ncbi:farnesyl-diphosphate synthase [Psychromonas ingrahamii 37]|uniref:Farnesyl-diphosphate synthase n=1 Tax=Psychromonas ingrahamii (strain DSM 17664 / CCUG 51855 / 37) TaxID=357804 RepID=A1SWW5_PSYIN|nr:(2E,6E)-farnesyl diphosphate synthase [Psychromonas ingrahamii]ABM03980.1 farnesyl-diphosphate synthase [Psychromonas ingrahamii 37]
MTQLAETLNQYQQRVDKNLNKYINITHPISPLLNEAMGYGALLGGKRVRPFLVYAVGDMLGCSLQSLDPLAAAVECIHAYSLIHDDLPAMDDDDLRRGQMTCHKKFDEATAILAGDALQTLAFDIISMPNKAITAQAQLKMVNFLAKAAGDHGMCAGQALDLVAENQSVNLVTLQKIHQAKTGALIKVAIQLAAMTKSDLHEDHFQLLNTFADAIGLAFQVQDDILDIIGDTQTLGKPQGSDLALHKSTYPALLGLEEAQNKAQALCHEAQLALSQLPYNTELLSKFAQYIIARDR